MINSVSGSSGPSGIAFSHKMSAAEMSGATAGKPQSEFDQILAAFKAAASETPVERAASAVLKKHGLTKDSMNRLPQAEKNAILKEIEKAIRRTLKVDDKHGGGPAQKV